MDAMRVIGIAIPAEMPLNAARTETMRRLQTAQGAEFDLAYLATELTRHQELQQLNIAVATGCRPALERAILTAAVPGIKTHIAMIGMLQEHHRG